MLKRKTSILIGKRPETMTEKIPASFRIRHKKIEIETAGGSVMGHLRLAIAFFMVLFIQVCPIWTNTGQALAKQPGNIAVWEFINQIPRSFSNPSFIDQIFSSEALILVANPKGEEKRRYQGIKEIKKFYHSFAKKLNDIHVEAKEIYISGNRAHANCILSFKLPLIGSKAGCFLAEMIKENDRWILEEVIIKV